MTDLKTGVKTYYAEVYFINFPTAEELNSFLSRHIDVLRSTQGTAEAQIAAARQSLKSVGVYKTTYQSNTSEGIDKEYFDHVHRYVTGPFMLSVLRPNLGAMSRMERRWRAYLKHAKSSYAALVKEAKEIMAKDKERAGLVQKSWVDTVEYAMGRIDVRDGPTYAQVILQELKANCPLD